MERAGPLEKLGSRERQIMEIIFRHGRATAAEVLEDLPDAPSNSAVRGMLRLLEDKGHLRHEYDGPRYVYLPTADPERVSRSAMLTSCALSSTTPPARPWRRCLECMRPDSATRISTVSKR